MISTLESQAIDQERTEKSKLEIVDIDPGT